MSLAFRLRLSFSGGNNLFTALSTNFLPTVVSAVFPTSKAADAACLAITLDASVESNPFKKALIESNIPDPP